MDNFSIYDKKNFIISVNYKANSIIDYFSINEKKRHRCVKNIRG